jgi:hypothetical protein
MTINNQEVSMCYTVYVFIRLISIAVHECNCAILIILNKQSFEFFCKEF